MAGVLGVGSETFMRYLEQRDNGSRVAIRGLKSEISREHFGYNLCYSPTDVKSCIYAFDGNLQYSGD